MQIKFRSTITYPDLIMWACIVIANLWLSRTNLLIEYSYAFAVLWLCLAVVIMMSRWYARRVE